MQFPLLEISATLTTRGDKSGFSSLSSSAAGVAFPIPSTMAKFLLCSDVGGVDSMNIVDFCQEVCNEPSYYDACQVIKLIHYKRIGAVGE